VVMKGGECGGEMLGLFCLLSLWLVGVKMGAVKTSGPTVSAAYLSAMKEAAGMNWRFVDGK
jgi:hypothetical protein